MNLKSRSFSLLTNIFSSFKAPKLHSLVSQPTKFFNLTKHRQISPIVPTNSRQLSSKVPSFASFWNETSVNLFKQNQNFNSLLLPSFKVFCPSSQVAKFSYEREDFRKIPDTKLKENVNEITSSFLETDRNDQGEFPKVGRAWRVNELRLKCFDDLHKLWYVLLKEKNLLMTERERYEIRGLRSKHDTRIHSSLKKVRQSMSRIKYVLHERSRLERFSSLPPELRRQKISGWMKRRKRIIEKRKAAKVQTQV